MTAPADVAMAPREPDANIADILARIGASARAAATTLSLVETAVKNRALEIAAVGMERLSSKHMCRFVAGYVGDNLCNFLRLLQTTE